MKLGGRTEPAWTTFPGDTTMATLEQVRAFAAGGSARIERQKGISIIAVSDADDHQKHRFHADAHLVSHLGIERPALPSRSLHRGVGCARCLLPGASSD